MISINLKKYILLSVAILMFQAHAMEQPKELDIFDAIGQGDVALVRKLIYEGKANMRTKSKYWPLMHASCLGKFEIVEELLKGYPHVDPKYDSYDSYGKTALYYAAANGYYDIVVRLLQEENYMLEKALYYIAKILKINIRPSLRADSEGFTPLMVAALNGHAEICSLLIREGASPDTVFPFKKNKETTLLMNASFRGNKKMVAMLLKNNADPNIRSSEGMTALMNAADSGSADVCSLLIAADADAFIRCQPPENTQLKRKTALSFAAIKNRLDCIPRIICGSFFLPSDWVLNKESFDRVISCLWSLKQLGMSRDLRNMLVCLALDKDVASILVSRIKNKQKIPAFAINLMVPVLYNSTAARWAIELPEVQREMAPITQLINENRIAHCSNIHPCPPAVLDMNNFEAHYGPQLRANIKKRLCERYAQGSMQTPAKKEPQGSEVDFRLDWWI